MCKDLIEKNNRAVSMVETMVAECASELMALDIPIRIDRVRCTHLMPLKDTFAGCYFCKCKGDMEFVIAIHSDFVNYMDDDMVVENVRNSIRHELIHTCLNAQEHNDIWLYWAMKCDTALGASTRVFKEREIYYNIHNGEHYVYRCNDCGYEYHSICNDFSDIQCDICGEDLHLV